MLYFIMVDFVAKRAYFISTLQGELALAFGELLRKLWSPGKAPVAPRAFKGKLARFAPQFSGYNQHDSQVCFVPEYKI